jgi:hypothetical protein
MSTAYWRINPIAMISAAVALISLFLPWWGIYEYSSGALTFLRRWDLWNPFGTAILRTFGRTTPTTATSISQTFSASSLVVLTLALVAAALALVGSLTLIRKYLVGGLFLSIVAPILYAVAISYVTYNSCLTPQCASGPIGYATIFNGTIFTWGFETGFYIFIASAVVLALAIFLNNSLARTTVIRKAELSVPTSSR